MNNPFQSSRSSVSSRPAMGSYDGRGSQAGGSRDRSGRPTSVGPGDRGRSGSRAPSTAQPSQVVAVKQPRLEMPRNVDLGGDAWAAQSMVRSKSPIQHRFYYSWLLCMDHPIPLQSIPYTSRKLLFTNCATFLVTQHARLSLHKHCIDGMMNARGCVEYPACIAAPLTRLPGHCSKNLHSSIIPSTHGQQ